MKKYYKIMFMSLMIMGTIIALSSYSWFSMWMGLEINLMSVIPLFLNPKNQRSTEASMKYFISQTIASSIIIFSLIMMMNNNIEIWQINKPHLMMNCMFMMKLGAAPLHFWFPEVIEGLNWENCLILMNWQKISPLIIISNNKPSNNILLIFIVSSLIISVILSINQTSTRKILAFSSINHIAWMLSSIMISSSSTILYFTIYSIMTINICMTMKSINSFKINQLNMKNKKINLIIMLNFMSMGGLPPMIGFLPKWILINKMTKINLFIMPLMLILSSLILLFVYTRLFFSLLMMSQSKKKSINKNNNSIPMIIELSMIINLSLILFSLSINLS